jgi:hypothetical protein
VDVTLALGHAINRVVMEEDNLIITGKVEIGLQHISALRQRQLE